MSPFPHFAVSLIRRGLRRLRGFHVFGVLTEARLLLPSVEGTLMLFNRFWMVRELSSAARIGATSFFAIDSRFSVFMAFS